MFIKFTVISCRLADKDASWSPIKIFPTDNNDNSTSGHNHILKPSDASNAVETDQNLE